MYPKVNSGSPAGTKSEQGSSAERRRLNVLFADLIGSTDLMEQLGADDYSSALRGYHTLCTEAVRAHGGTIAQYQGDGLMCFFGFPVASEDDACQAVSAALDILAALEAHNKGQEIALHTRIGIATGTAIVSLGTSHFGGETVGACLNLASRLQDKAGRNRVVICEETLELIGDRFRVRDLGRLQLKGFAEPRQAYEVSGAVAGVISRFDAHIERNNTPRIDREREGSVLAEGFARAQRGTGHSIRIGGSAGLGKSRITRDVLANPDLKGTPTFILQCAPEYSAVPLHPVRAYLDWITGVRRSDDLLVRQEKLRRLFTVVWQADADETELLLDLLAPDADAAAPPSGNETINARRQRAFEVLSRRMFGAIGRSRAFAMIFEDVHWIDPTTLELLTYLLEQVPNYPILLIATYRSEAEPVMATLNFDEALQIDPLPESYARDLAVAAASNFDLDQEAIAKIVTLAEGVPLFLEEYARMTAKSKGGADLGIPLTLSGIVLSKLDHVDERSRHFAKCASVLGRNFEAPVVAAIFGFEVDAVPAIILALTAEQIVTQTGQDSFVFSHALIRDGIYDTIDFRSRRNGHIAVAEWLAASAEAQALKAVVALHFGRGGEVRQAIDWYMKAAQHAAGEGAASEAMASLNGAAEQVAKLEPGAERERLELDVLAIQGPVWMILRGPGSPDFGATQERARVMLEQLGEESTVVTFHTALHSWARGRLTEALERVDRLDALESTATYDDGFRLAQNTMRGLVYWHIAENLEAERLLGDTVALYDVGRHSPVYAQYLMEFGVFGRFYLALTKTVLGKFEEGAALALDAAQLADVLPFPHAKGFSHLANFVCAMLRRDVAPCMRFADQALAYSSAQGFPEFVAMATFAKGWAQTEIGDRKAGLVLMREGLQNWDRTGFICWQSIYSALLASALIDDRQFSEARRVLDSADALVGETGESQAQAPLCLSRAKLAAATGEAALAEALAAQALTFCDEQSAGLWRNQILEAFPQVIRPE